MLNNDLRRKNPYNWNPKPKFQSVDKKCPHCGVLLKIYPDLDVVKFNNRDSGISDENTFRCPHCGIELQSTDDFDLFET